MAWKLAWAWSGAAVAVLLMVIALWAWGTAGWLTADAARPEIERLAVRSAAVSAGAIAQVLLLTFVAGWLYGPRKLTTDALRLTASVVAGVALVSAVALGLAGR